VHFIVEAQVLGDGGNRYAALFPISFNFKETRTSLQTMKSFVALIACLQAFFFTYGQQMADTGYSPPPFSPAYVSASASPLVIIDEAHYNFHTADGRFAPFAKLLRSDGFRVARGTSSFSDSMLKQVRVLVIANALNAANRESWRLPTPSAFTDDEITVVNNWVKAGGSLFLIADHMPFPGAAERLASSFGFKFYNGFAMDTAAKSNGDLFTLSDGSLTKTSEPGFQMPDTVASFTGQGFDAPGNAICLLKLRDAFQILLPQEAWQFDKVTPRIAGSGKCQGAIMKFGKGRVAVFGEAAMFTAQTAGNRKVGMNTRSGKKNYLLLLSIMHWLA